MLVLTREAGTSILVEASDETCLVTVLKILPDRRAAEILVARACVQIPGRLDAWSVCLELGGAVPISGAVDVVLVQVREEKAKVRLGINAPPDVSVRRIELRDDGGGPDIGGGPYPGPAGSPVPQPPSPKPPSLDVRLDEPGSSDEAGE